MIAYGIWSGRCCSSLRLRSLDSRHLPGASRPWMSSWEQHLGWAWMRPWGLGPGVDAHPFSQVCTALGQVRTASGQVLTPFPPAIHPPYYML